MFQDHKPIYQLLFICFRTMNTLITIIHIFQDQPPFFIQNCHVET